MIFIISYKGSLCISCIEMKYVEINHLHFKYENNIEIKRGNAGGYSNGVLINYK